MKRQKSSASVSSNKKANNNWDPVQYSSLARAIKIGDLKRTRKLINSFGAFNTSDKPDGYFLLKFAINHEHPDIAKLLLTNGSLVYINEKSADTPLHSAVRKGYLDIVEMLLDKGAKIEAKNQFGLTPLYYAVFNKNIEITNLLINRGADINNTNQYPNLPTLLHLAAKVGCLEIVERLLNLGFCINAVENIGGFTPLHLSINGNHSILSSFLINKGADINSKTLKGYTPLHLASMRGNHSITECLLKHGACINSQTLEGFTPLYLAVNSRSQKVVNVLLQHGVNIDENICNQTILDHAVKTQDFLIVKNILKYSPDINNQNNKSSLKTAILSYGHEQGHEYKNIVEALLQYGFTIEPEYENHPNLIYIAIGKGVLKLVEYLLNRGVDVNYTFETISKTTLLHIAVIFKQEEVAKLLINYGADVNAQDMNEKSPMFYAYIYNYLNIAEILVTNKANIGKHYNLLNIAIVNGHINLVKALLPHVDIHRRDQCNRTALHFTALRILRSNRCLDYVSHTRGEIAKLLISKGANINAITNKGETTLHGAVRNKYKKLVKILLEYGADINLKTEKNQTPWRFAHSYDSNENFRDNIMERFKIFNRQPDSDNEYNNNRYQVIETLKLHLIKMHKANFYVNPQDLHSILKLNIHFQDKCMVEISCMKSQKIINTNISFYDILTKDINSLEMYMRNENIFQALKSGDYEIKFPIYASMIRNNFRRSMERNMLLEQSKKIAYLLFKNYPQLSSICTEKIFSFLDNEDLKSLINVQPSRSYFS